MGGAKVLVMFATQTGNSRQIAKEVRDTAITKGHSARLMDMINFQTVNFAEEDVVVVVASSTGNGDCPDNGDKFFRYCKRKTTPQVLSSCQFAVCALGDSNYDAFCSVGKEFDRHFERLGGTRLLQRVDVDEVDGIETHVDPWMDRLWDALNNLCNGDAPAAKEAEEPATKKKAESEAEEQNVAGDGAVAETPTTETALSRAKPTPCASAPSAAAVAVNDVFDASVAVADGGRSKCGGEAGATMTIHLAAVVAAATVGIALIGITLAKHARRG